jgi:hypothetical protein
VQFKITKDDTEKAIILRAGDAVEEKPQIDETYVPDKLCPFIMDDGTPLQQEPPSVKLTDL